MMDFQDQIQIYGCTLAELKSSVEKTMTVNKIGPVQLAINYTAVIKDYVQGDKKVEATQYANRLKWVLTTYIMDDDE